jgi:predicted choloylglycine hydrolase
LLASNLYYDLLKFVFSGVGPFGCTTFAVDTDGGPMHARNLDWFSEGHLLRDNTIIYDFRKAGSRLFEAVSWPGYVAVLSGMAPDRFAITLNAVLSEEKAKLAKPISFLIREVLEESQDYDSAVKELSSTPMAADCLLLVTGIRRGQMCVIERTPRRSEIRTPDSEHIIVTNDYRKLRDAAFDWGSDLDSTSSSRFDRVASLLKKALPDSFEDCFEILDDLAVHMDITMQHMVMSASQSRLEVRLPRRNILTTTQGTRGWKETRKG